MGVTVASEPRKPKRPNRSEVERPTGLLALSAAYGHPMRIRILAAMNSPRRQYSPIQLAEAWGLGIGTVSYHFRELVNLGFLEIVDERKIRGAVEHVHQAKANALAWEKEWEDLPQFVRQHMLALTNRLGIEAIGAAIDNGTFESRDDTVMAQDTMRVDERGATEVLVILAKALELCMKAGDQAAERLAESGEDGVLISYMTVGYEGALRPL
jgi:AraC-like DNA-binding protein